MGRKPKLFEVDEDIWSQAKLRASTLMVDKRQMTLSEFVEQAIAAHLVHTATASASNMLRASETVEATYASAISNYTVTDGSTGAPLAGGTFSNTAAPMGLTRSLSSSRPIKKKR